MRRTALTLSSAALTVGVSGLLGTPLAAAGGSCHQVISMESGVTQVIADHACWNPVVAQIAVGETLTFVNQGGLEHNLGGLGPIEFDEFKVGGMRKIHFPEAGIFPYACTLHPQMVGAVVVGNPLADQAAQAAPAAAAPVDLSTSDDDSGSLIGSTAVRVGSGAAVAAVLGAGLVAVRRRRAALPTT